MLRTWLRAGLIAAALVAGLEMLLVIAVVAMAVSAPGEALTLLLATAALNAVAALPLAGGLALLERFVLPRLPEAIRAPRIEALLGIAIGAPLAAYLVGVVSRLSHPADLEFAEPAALLERVATIGVVAVVAVAVVAALPVLRRLGEASPRLLRPRALLVGLASLAAVLMLVLAHLGLFSIHQITPAGWAGVGALALATLAVRLASRARPLSRRGTWILGASATGLLVGGAASLRDPHARFVIEVHAPTAGYLANALGSLADIDGDGAPPTWLGGADCAEGNAAIGPGRREIAGDGIDQDCRGGDAAVRPADPPTPYPGCTPPAAPLSVLLITIDAFRADALDPLTTPNLMTFARSAIVHTRATSPATNTAPSVTSLLTGRPVSDLIPGGNVLATGDGDATTDRSYNFGTPLPHLFRLAGFQTAAINPFALFESGDFRRLAGFNALDAYAHDVPVATAKDALMSAQIVDGILQHVRSATEGRRLFLWAHLPDLHAPYLPAGITPAPAPGAPNGHPAYLRGVRYVDNQLGRLLMTLHAEHLDERFVIAITSDHGEDLGQRGREGHGPNLYEESIHVPLLVSIPGCAPRILEEPVSVTALVTTLAQAVGVAAPGDTLAQGRPYAVAEAAYARDHRRAISTARGKLIVSVRTGGRVLFDLAADPGETRDVHATASALRAELEGYYQHWLDRP